MSYRHPPNAEPGVEGAELAVSDDTRRTGDFPPPRALPPRPLSLPPFVVTRQTVFVHAEAGRAPSPAHGIALPAPLYFPQHGADLQQDPRHNFVPTRGPIPALYLPPPPQPTNAAWSFVPGPMYVAPAIDWDGRPILLWRNAPDFRAEWQGPVVEPATQETVPRTYWDEHPTRERLPLATDDRLIQPPFIARAQDDRQEPSLRSQDDRLPPAFAPSQFPVFGEASEAAQSHNPPPGPVGHGARVLQTVLEEDPLYSVLDPVLLGAEAYPFHANWDPALDGLSETESTYEQYHSHFAPPRAVTPRPEVDRTARASRAAAVPSAELPSSAVSSRGSPIGHAPAQPPSFKETAAGLDGDTAMASIRRWLAIQLAAADEEVPRGDRTSQKKAASESV